VRGKGGRAGGRKGKRKYKQGAGKRVTGVWTDSDVFIYLHAPTHRYDWTLLIPCFIAGLLGGAVYVAGFSLISRNTREEYRELALVSASIADTIGIMLSDVCGLLLQVSKQEILLCHSPR
jgi:MFS family permease